MADWQDLVIIIIPAGFLSLQYEKKRIEYGKPVITMSRKSGLISIPGSIKKITLLSIIVY
jgi:hypothetical protein